jgi:hypothetical protein
VFRFPRKGKWQETSVSVILMTYAGRNSIRATIEGHIVTGPIGEMLAIKT